MQKRGELSRLAVNLLIGSLIIILGVIIWIILRGGSSENQEVFTDENIDLKISQVKTVDDSTLGLTLNRGTGEGEFVGLSFVVSDGSLTEVVRVNSSMPENQTGNFSLNFISLNTSKIKSISVTPIYINEEGVEVIGDVKDEYVTPNTCSNYCPVGAQCGFNDCGMQCGNGCDKGYLCLNYKCIKQQTSSGGGGSGGGGGSSGGETCTDTCSSLSYQCGTRIICEQSTSCGSCQTNYSCQNNGTCIKDIPQCVPATCNSLNRNCGTVSDECNGTLNCGNCSTGYNCHTNGTCIAIPCTDTCNSLGYTCGQQTVCGSLINCGNCTYPQTCNATNMCSCTSETNTAFCTRLNKNCGSVTANDNCGVSKTVNCGTCTSPNTCNVTNMCSCTVSSYTPALNTFCGSRSVTTNCGTTVTRNGTLTCSSGYTCAANGTCIMNCVSHSSSSCYNGDVYWYNSCNARETIRYDCNSTQTCSSGVCVNNPPVGTQIIADHTVVNRYDDIPQCWIDEVKKMWVSIPGESHAEGYYTGVLLLEQMNSEYSVNLIRSGTPEAYTEEYLRMNGAMWGDISHATGWQYGISTWDWAGGEPFAYTYDPAQATRVMNGLSYAHNNGITISAIGYGWCYNEEYITSYITATQNFADYCEENNLPTKVFFSTGPADSHLSNADQESYESYLRWKTIRDYVAENSTRILFDYNDILSYNDAGVQQTKNWNGHIFPVIHPDNMEGDVGEWSSGHIGGNGCLRVGKAMWWMLARIAGWDGVSTTCP